ncbi:MAG: ABC transporter substrate-binding protein [Gammaproteobacteria bacterium]
MFRLALLLLFALPAAAQDAPQRIVSMSLCTDLLLLRLVEPQRIASLSYLATDPTYSSLATLAQGIPSNRAQAEEVLAFAPDLVLTSQFSATLAANLLERLGHPVHRLGFAATADEVYAQIRETATATHTTERGEALVTELQSVIETERQRIVPRLRGKRAAFLANNGFSYGAGSLQHDFLVSLGLHNIAADAGLRGPAQLPLEALIAAQPDFVLVDRRGQLDMQLAQPLLQHPALAALGASMRLVDMPDSLFQCAGPEFAEAYRRFAAQLELH